jgi:hypothetical protein
VAVSVRAKRIVRVSQEYDGPNAHTYEIAAYDQTGKLLFSKRRPFDRVQIEKRIVDSVVNYFAMRVEGMSNPSAAVRSVLRVPPSVPPMRPQHFPCMPLSRKMAGV